MRVLSHEDVAFFENNGYVVVPNAVPPAQLQAVVDAAFDFLGMNPDAPEDWYRLPLTPGGMIELYQHQALWDNRQNERVWGAFADLHRTEKLWVSFDRANVKPPFHPEHPNYDNPGLRHWDIEVTRAASMPFGTQGVLYLTDTDADMGGFHCSPGHHKVASAWAAMLPREQGEKPDMSEVPFVPIVGKAGDLVIWNNRLYHGNGRNTSTKPRLAQYITMSRIPVGDAYETRRQDRIMRWRDRLSPDANWAPGDPRHWEETNGTTATLTALGRKLLGLDTWDE